MPKPLPEGKSSGRYIRTNDADKAEPPWKLSGLNLVGFIWLSGKAL